jgi:hypothetical protein
MGKIIEIDTKKCFECGGTKYIHQHHIIPKSIGGTKTIPLCITCHSRVHQKDFVKFQNLAKEGRKRYLENGGKLGRRTGSNENIQSFLQKPKVKQIKSMLEQGYSIRLICSVLSVSTTTVIKVKKIVGITKTPLIIGNSEFWSSQINSVEKYRPAKRVEEYCKNK